MCDKAPKHSTQRAGAGRLHQSQSGYPRCFRLGWDSGISGAFLRGTFGTPAGLSNELRPAWSAGWDCGSKPGIERYWSERKKRNRERSMKP
jgi:hypothetical protein